MGEVRTHYIDASALVKMFVAEDGSSDLRKYVDRHANVATTSICFAEALGALKVKARRKLLSQEQYLAAAEELMAYVRSGSLTIDDVGVSERHIFDKVEALAKKYDLDVSDAYQLVTLQQGLFSSLEGDSKPILITADDDLASAAKCEGLRHWHCLRDPAP